MFRLGLLQRKRVKAGEAEEAEEAEGAGVMAVSRLRGRTGKSRGRWWAVTPTSPATSPLRPQGNIKHFKLFWIKLERTIFFMCSLNP